MLSLLKDIALHVVGRESPDLPEEPTDIELTNVHFELEMPLQRWTWKAQRKMWDVETDANQNPESAECAEKLSDCYMARCRRFRIMGRWNEAPGEPMLDSEAAIRAIKKAIVFTTKESHSALVRRYSKESILREYRFSRAGNIEDLEDAISTALGVIHDTPEDHPALPHRLTNLGNMLASRFERKGYMEDIDSAVEHAEKAVKCAKSMNAEERDYLKGRLMRNVAVKLEMRDQGLSSVNDLENAIAMMDIAIKSMNQDHPDWALFKSELGNMIASRARRTKKISDLDEAIQTMESALAALPKEHPSRCRLLNTLGNRYLDRFRRLGDTKDLEKSFNTAWKASTNTPLNHPDSGKHWCSLASKYIVRAEEAPTLVHMVQAMNFASRGPGRLPEGHPMEAEALECLGDAFMMKHDFVKNPYYYAEAVGKYIEATQAENAPPLTIIRMHKKLAECVTKTENWNEAAKVYTRAITLWSRLSPRTLSRDDMEFVVRHLSGLGSMAAVCILNDLQGAANALVALESSRGMMASLTINSRSDVSDLKEEHPDLYNQYTALQDAVSSNISADGELGQSAEELMNAAISKRNHEIRSLDALAEQIRSLEGFGHFQQPPSYSELVRLAEFGPIVCFNITPDRCDAFLVTRNGIQSLRLSVRYDWIRRFVQELVREKKITSGPQSEASKRNQRLRELLRDLWKYAVRPVLKSLGLLSKELPAKLPRIWWITSGLMGLLPLHAAGSDWGVSRENTASHVVSSYVPTFRALAYARQKRLKSLLEPGRECLIVSMPKTNGKNDLKVAKEVNAVKVQLESQANTVTLLEIATEKEVRERLQSASIAHFACHGESESLSPSSSGLLLANSRLTVRNLAAMSLDKAQIAYLSACSTAENKADDELVDESIHIASAFQLVGFPHVIGTLWPASNKVAEVVAPKFYNSLDKHLKSGENNNDAVAYALDDAVKSLWGRKKTEDVVRWCPFVHMGA